MKFFAKIKRIPTRIRKSFSIPLDFEDQIYHGLVNKGDVVFDIGANVGAVACYLSKLAGRTGSVIAFEPVWPTYQRLCTQIRSQTKRDALIIPIPLGISNVAGVCSVQVPDGSFGMASLASCKDWGDALSETKMVSYDCNFVSLEEFMGVKHLAHPQFIKIDVEGAELLVLRGASAVLGSKQPPIMLIEIFAPWEKAFNYRPWDVLSLLKEYGYHFLFACPEGLVDHVPTIQNPFPEEYKNGYNVIAFISKLHDSRIMKLDHLRAGRGGKRLNMAPPPQLNVSEPI